MAKIRLSRVLFKDEQKVMLECALVEDYTFDVKDGEEFLSVIFVKAVPDEVTGRIKMVDWDPFDKGEEDATGE